METLNKSVMIPRLHLGLAPGGYRLFDETGRAWFSVSYTGDDDETERIGEAAIVAINGHKDLLAALNRLNEIISGGEDPGNVQCYGSEIASWKALAEYYNNK